jgi:hypothetical protein
MGFKEAVLATSLLAHAYRRGLQALKEADRNRVTCGNTRRLRGSVNLDVALAARCPNEPVWDYGIGVASTRNPDRVWWLEVHPATAGNVPEVIAKLNWLKTWLVQSGSPLRQMRSGYVWVASGSVSIPRHGRHLKLLAVAGLRFAGKHLVL